MNLEAEALAELSLHLTQHVNRFGLYHLDLERQPQAISFDVPIATKKFSMNPEMGYF